ncbi:MAG: PaaI family thioesterase [Gammaproteobacteria bacterium]|nr:PaaI family thioesterase [Gammaproteobacteria bacterium]
MTENPRVLNHARRSIITNDTTTFDAYIGAIYDDDAGESHINIQSHHCNPTGNINGGVLISLADNLSTGAANRAYFEKFGEHKFMVGVDLHAVMLSNQRGGRITARSTPVRVGRRITVIRTEVRGDEGKLLTDVTTTHVPT